MRKKTFFFFFNVKKKTGYVYFFRGDSISKLIIIQLHTKPKMTSIRNKKFVNKLPEI